MDGWMDEEMDGYRLTNIMNGCQKEIHLNLLYRAVYYARESGITDAMLDLAINNETKDMPAFEDTDSNIELSKLLTNISAKGKLVNSVNEQIFFGNYIVENKICYNIKMVPFGL